MSILEVYDDYCGIAAYLADAHHPSISLPLHVHHTLPVGHGQMMLILHLNQDYSSFYFFSLFHLLFCTTCNPWPYPLYPAPVGRSVACANGA